MRKTVLNITFLALATVALSSCYNKQYDCTCTDTANQTFLEDVIANSKKKAADKCKSLEISGKFSRTTTCELK
jgi:hypothetical protein